jgi:hypothetical protein
MSDLIFGPVNGTGLLHYFVPGVGHLHVRVRVPGAEDEALLRYDEGIVDYGKEPLFHEGDNAGDPLRTGVYCPLFRNRWLPRGLGRYGCGLI